MKPLNSSFFAGAGAAGFDVATGATVFAGSFPSCFALSASNSSTFALIASLSALFNFKSLTSFPTFKISASKSDPPDDEAAGAAAGADGLLSLKKLMLIYIVF